MNAFVIGLGRRSRAHLDVLQTSAPFTCVAGFDIAPQVRESARKAGVAVDDDLDAGLRRADPKLVVVATPPGRRLEVVEQVFRSSRPRWLVLEKPLALSVKEGSAIAARCRDGGVRLVIGHQLPYTPEFSVLREWVQGGSLGRVRALRLSCYGSLFDQGSHLLDLAGHLVGPPGDGEWAEGSAIRDAAPIRDLLRLPPDYAPDEAHHGAARLSGLVRTSGGQTIHVECGLLTPAPVPVLGPWLQKRIVVEGSRGWAEAQVASHAVLQVEGRSGVRVDSDPRRYERSLEGFYQALLDDGSLPDEAHDLGTLMRLESLARASRSGVPVAVGVAEFPKTVTVATDDGPEISVILPMEDHRGFGLRAVSSWTRSQTCEASRFEVIVLVDEASSHLVDGIKPLLRPHDVLIEEEPENEMAHYDLGARRARGRYMFFTEPHCVAEPHAVAEALAFFARGVADGFCGRSTGIAPNAIARLEERMYDDGFVEWSRPEHFAKVIMRAVGLTREAYLETGGFKSRFDRFAEWLLAAELKQRGYRLLYAPGVGVAHLYSDSFPLLDRFIREFTDGECAFRVRHGDDPMCWQYFGDPPEWTEALEFDGALLARSCRALLAGAVGRGIGVRDRLGNLRRLAKCGWKVLAGERALTLRYRMRALGARWLAAQPWLGWAARYRHFCRYWQATTSLCRVRYALSQAPAPSGCGEESALRCFHPRETYGDATFRWSEPTWAVRVPASSEAQTLVIELLDKRTVDDLERCLLWLDGSRLNVNIQMEEGQPSLIAQLPPRPEEAWIHGVAPTWLAARRGGDPRDLGLPVRGIRLGETRS